MGACTSACSASPQQERINQRNVDRTHFTILKLLGKGGYADVFVSRPRTRTTYHSYKRVAIKRIEKRRLIVPCRRKAGETGPRAVRLSSTVWIERDVLRRCRDSNFHVELLHSFQDESYLYLVMPFMQGGDLQHYLKTYGIMNEAVARFYMAELIFALEYLHDMQIIYRDLKPRNVLLQEDGHLVLSDYGLCKQLRARDHWMTTGRAGTRGFQAPEVLSGSKYSYSCDFFSLAVTIFRLFTGRRPFGRNGDDFSRPLRCSSLSNEANDIVRALLEPNPHKRLGCTPVPEKVVPELQSDKKTLRKNSSRASSQQLCNTYDWDAVRGHPFFRDVDWDAMRVQQVAPPHKPVGGMTTNFPKTFPAKRGGGPRDRALSSHNEDGKEQTGLTPEQQALFDGFEWNTDWERMGLVSTTTSSQSRTTRPGMSTRGSGEREDSSASGGAASCSRMSQHRTSVGVSLSGMGITSLQPEFSHGSKASPSGLVPFRHSLNVGASPSSGIPETRSPPLVEI